MTVTCSEFDLMKREGPFSFGPDLVMVKLQTRGRVFCRGKWCSRVNLIMLVVLLDCLGGETCRNFSAALPRYMYQSDQTCTDLKPCLLEEPLYLCFFAASLLSDRVMQTFLLRG